jgi:PD-(D/E)XK nuclease superfamily protein
MRKNRWAGRMIRNCKKRGEWVELVFAVRAMELGLVLARPWGESSGYDFTVDQGTRIVRVQVKSTIFKESAEGYSCTLKDSKGPYKKNTFDFVAAYVIPEDVWFILPEKVVRGMWSVGLYPKLERAKYREYQEAWYLLRGETPGKIDCIQACAEDSQESPLLAKDARNGAPRSPREWKSLQGSPSAPLRAGFDYACGFIKRIRMLRSG